MKCYKCNGTGYYDIDNECPVCDGTGEYEPFDADVELDKLYPTEQTNEEWFCQLSTKEKATFLASNKMLNFDYQMWLEWLKEKHNG